jgi:ferredoxin
MNLIRRSRHRPPPSTTLPPARVDLPFTVELHTSGEQVTVEADESILQALERHGVEVPYLCRHGICGTCETALLAGAGAVEHRDSYLTDEQRARGDAIIVCTSRATAGAQLTLDR